MAYGGQGRGLAGMPEADGNARLGSPRAARPLIGRGARHFHGLQPGDAGRWLMHWQALQAGINDDAHTVDGNGRLRNRRRQHDLARARGPPADGRILCLHVEIAVKRHHMLMRTRLPVSRSATRSISARPGRKARMEPVSSASASRIAFVTASSTRSSPLRS